jgi:hypothetical protein
LDKYAEEESSRTQKLKEQLLIYFALTKKYFSIDKQNTGEIARDGHKI